MKVFSSLEHVEKCRASFVCFVGPQRCSHHQWWSKQCHSPQERVTFLALLEHVKTLKAWNVVDNSARLPVTQENQKEWDSALFGIRAEGCLPWLTMDCLAEMAEHMDACSSKDQDSAMAIANPRAVNTPCIAKDDDGDGKVKPSSTNNNPPLGDKKRKRAPNNKAPSAANASAKEMCAVVAKKAPSPKNDNFSNAGQHDRVNADKTSNTRPCTVSNSGSKDNDKNTSTSKTTEKKKKTKKKVPTHAEDKTYFSATALRPIEKMKKPPANNTAVACTTGEADHSGTMNDDSPPNLFLNKQPAPPLGGHTVDGGSEKQQFRSDVRCRTPGKRLG